MHCHMKFIPLLILCNIFFNVDTVVQMLFLFFQESPAIWKNCMWHTKKLMKKSWEINLYRDREPVHVFDTAGGQ
jgi:hypothetical protein